MLRSLVLQINLRETSKSDIVTTHRTHDSACDRFDAIQKARTWVLTTEAARRAGFCSRPQCSPRLPAYGSEELLGIVNPDIRLPMDMMEILLRIVDDSRIEQFKPSFGKGMITAWALIHGMRLKRLSVPN
jgi:acetyl-CoA carboxylase carboxyltransferase component